MPILRQKKIVQIGIGVRLNHRHHGYYSDLINGVINTALKFSARVFSDEKNVYSSPIMARFIKNDVPVPATMTKNLNIDATSRIFEPYFDEIIPASAIDREEYINEVEVLTTV